jgi:arsenate reductase
LDKTSSTKVANKPPHGGGLEGLILYGIPNCDTTKKVLQLLKKEKADFSFHNYKEKGITKEKLQEWIDKVGIETIFNKRSTTWKELDEVEKKKAESIIGAVEIMIKHNSIIKRPIIVDKSKIMVGYNEKEILNVLKK